MSHLDPIVWIAEARHQEMLRQAEALRLLRQAQPQRQGWLSRLARTPLSHLGRLLLTLGRQSKRHSQPQIIIVGQLAPDCCSGSGSECILQGIV